MILCQRKSQNSSILARPTGPNAQNIMGRVAFAAGILFSLTGASEPEVVRVRVPVQDVSRFFRPAPSCAC